MMVEDFPKNCRNRRAWDYVSWPMAQHWSVENFLFNVTATAEQ